MTQREILGGSNERFQIGMISENGRQPVGNLRTELQKAERRLARMTRLTAILPDSLNNMDENDPAQAKKILQKATKIGNLSERINNHFKPTLEERIATIKQQLYEDAQGTNRQFGRIRELGKRGFLPPRAVAIATTSYFIHRAAIDTTLQTEQSTNHETQISPLNTAIMALAIADAYITQKDEEVFSLQGFYSFFGQACASLPPRELADLDSYQYRKLRQEAVRKFASKANIRDASGETTEVANLLNWIRIHIKDQYSFFNAVLAAEDYGDVNSQINLRDKFKKVLITSHEKYFSLHPETKHKITTTPEKAISIRTEEEGIDPNPRGITRNGNPKESSRPKTTPAEQTPEEEITLSEGDDHALNWLINGYRQNEPTVIADQAEARELTLKAGIPILFNQVDELLALWNLIVSRANGGATLTIQTAERMRILIRKRLKQKTKKN